VAQGPPGGPKARVLLRGGQDLGDTAGTSTSGTAIIAATISTVAGHRPAGLRPGQPPVERTGMVGAGTYSRITPAVSWSGNLDGEPVGDEWYPLRRAEHRRPGGSGS